LQKRIPPGSGLGGGSSDAAAVLRLLSRALDTPLPSDELQSLAAGLGADVMFFLADVPLALGWGRGERLGAHPGLDPLPMLLALPDVHVSTAQAYALWDEQAGSSGRRSPAEAGELDDSGLTSWSELARHACNDFESVVFEQLPVLRTLKQRFGETQPLLAQLSGSGSALFAVYETARQRDQAAPHIRQGVEGIRLVSARGPW
jgi:4-diphosphocytidyl-2-C-methyl-D-erythritol kinase